MTYAQIEATFVSSSVTVRAEMLVFGFDYWHHKPEYLLRVLRQLPVDEQKQVAAAIIELEPRNRLQVIAAEILNQ